jgi:hypothetical protein
MVSLATPQISLFIYNILENVFQIFFNVISIFLPNFPLILGGWNLFLSQKKFRETFSEVF